MLLFSSLSKFVLGGSNFAYQLFGFFGIAKHSYLCTLFTVVSLIGAPASYVNSQPIVINGRSNIVISGVQISNANGHCIDIKGNSQNVIIRDSKLGPCGGSGVSVTSSRGIRLEDLLIITAGLNGVTAYDVDGIDVLDSHIEDVQTGVHAVESDRVNISFNTFKNVKGPMPRGQFVQFDKVYGGGNRINCNVGENILGQSYAEDAISLYQTYGTSSDPVQVIGNKIRGGGPSTSGGGIMLGDSGGSYQLAQNNVLVDPGQYGIGVASGTRITVKNNSVYAKSQPFTNVGIYVWNQYDSSCNNITVEGNLVNWKNSSGASNPGWNGGNCGTVRGWSNNVPYAEIGPSIFDQPMAVCRR